MLLISKPKHTLRLCFVVTIGLLRILFEGISLTNRHSAGVLVDRARADQEVMLCLVRQSLHRVLGIRGRVAHHVDHGVKMLPLQPFSQLSWLLAITMDDLQVICSSGHRMLTPVEQIELVPILHETGDQMTPDKPRSANHQYLHLNHTPEGRTQTARN